MPALSVNGGITMKGRPGRALLYILFVVLALLWGLSFVFTKMALEELKPSEIMAVRWMISAVLYTILWVTGVAGISFRGKPLKPLLLLVLIEPIAYAYCETWGINLTTPSESSIFISSIPLAVVAMNYLILHRKPTLRESIGVLAGFAGVATCIIFAPGASAGSKLLGYFLLICTVICGGGYNLAACSASEHYSPVEMSCAMAIGGGLVFNIQNLIEGNGLHAYSVLFSGGTVMWALLFLGVGCSFMAYFIFNLELSNLPPIATSCIATNTINIVGVVAGILISHDPWGVYTVIGVILTAIGITVAATGTMEKPQEESAAES